MEYELKYIPSNPTMSNDAKMVEIVKQAAVETVGSEKIMEYYCMGGEDFSEFSHRVPSCFFFTGSGNREKKTDYPHHHTHFDIDEDSLPIGVEMFVRVVMAQLSEGKDT
ncbi:M20/M25/M40 family metallo-hydrolase [Ruminococcaceae bacterium OttesenSCG-928-I18]|nr:M20/M25/M40 family metallo-hydrolase [Ruminococcaceae bacterium OttesenSCG-928-I18]